MNYLRKTQETTKRKINLSHYPTVNILVYIFLVFENACVDIHTHTCELHTIFNWNHTMFCNLLLCNRSCNTF